MTEIKVPEDRHPSVRELAEWFSSTHLAHPDGLAAAQACEQLARTAIEHLQTDGPELTTGLRKLLEAKDCFVRHAIKSGWTP